MATLKPLGSYFHSWLHCSKHSIHFPHPSRNICIYIYLCFKVAKPDNVVLELCRGRTAVLYHPQERTAGGRAADSAESARLSRSDHDLSTLSIAGVAPAETDCHSVFAKFPSSLLSLWPDNGHISALPAETGYLGSNGLAVEAIDANIYSVPDSH